MATKVTTSAEQYYSFNGSNQYYNSDQYYQGLDDELTADYYSLSNTSDSNSSPSNEGMYTKFTRDLLGVGTIIEEEGVNGKISRLNSDLITSQTSKGKKNVVNAPEICFSNIPKFDIVDSNWEIFLQELIEHLHNPLSPPPSLSSTATDSTNNTIGQP